MILSLIIALVLIAGSTLILARGVKTVRASRRRRVIGIAFGLTVGLGLAVGFRFCVLGDFQLSERFRIQGAPIPLVVFVFEGQGWTDFVKPALVGYPCMVANALFPAGLVGLLWVLATKRRQRTPQLPPDQPGLPREGVG